MRFVRSAELMPPRKLGKFEVLARLASGSSGHVFLARRPRLGGYAPVCLKVVSRGAEPEQVEGLLAEGRLLSSFDHPSIIEVLELDPGPPAHLVLELIVGERLDWVMDHAREGGSAVPAPVAATIVQNLLEALHHAHVRVGGDAAAHRDVAPPNIMLSFEGQTKLLDFGIAQHDRARATVTGLIRGRPGYMSPEQVTGGRVDVRTDVYAAGVILWELLANDRLYGTGDAAQVAWAQRRLPPDLLERGQQVPPALAQIAQRALQRQPEARYATAAAMSEALGQYLDAARAAWGVGEVAKLLKQRFPQRRADRQAALQALDHAEYDEARVMSAFDGRPVLALDLDVLDEATLPVAVGNEGSLDADPASRITERGPAQISFEDRTEAEDPRTLLDPFAQALVFESTPSAPISAPPEDPPADPALAPAAAPQSAGPAATGLTQPGELAQALDRDSEPTVFPLPPVHPHQSPSSVKKTEGVDPTQHLQVVVPPKPEAAPAEAPAPPVQPPEAAKIMPTPSNPGLFQSWRFWLVLLLGMVMGIVGGAVVTWALMAQ